MGSSTTESVEKLTAVGDGVFPSPSAADSEDWMTPGEAYNQSQNQARINGMPSEMLTCALASFFEEAGG
jgi:hypothetical protein